MRTADAFTWVRIIFAPIFYVLFMIPEWTGLHSQIMLIILWPLLIFAEFTDFLDGYFARKHNAVSDFGKFFDPFADVILHLTAFFCYASIGLMPIWCLLLITLREISIQFVRLMAQREGVAMGAAMGGKIKTVLYIVTGMFSLILVTLVRFGLAGSTPMNILVSANIVLYIVCVLASYASFAHYILLYFKAKKAREL